jgi:hypothetical protein
MDQMTSKPNKAAEDTSAVKIEDGTETAATPATIAEPKTVTTDTFGNKIEEA